MTLTLTTNENNDIFIGDDGNLSTSRGIEAVKFIAKGVAETQRGEIVLDVEKGLPNFESLWNGVPNIPQYEAALRLALSEVQGVESIESLVVANVEGVFKYTAVLKTTAGLVTI